MTTDRMTSPLGYTTIITWIQSIIDALFAKAPDEQSITTGQVIAEAEAYVDLPPWRAGAVAIPLQPEDGSFNSTSEWAVGNIRTGPGRHIVFIRGRDSAGNWGPITAVFSPHANS